MKSDFIVFYSIKSTLPRFLSSLKDWLSYSKPTEENTLGLRIFLPTWELLTGKYRTHEKSKAKGTKRTFPTVQVFCPRGNFSLKKKKTGRCSTTT